MTFRAYIEVSARILWLSERLPRQCAKLKSARFLAVHGTWP
jgi:hypothetical protein